MVKKKKSYCNYFERYYDMIIYDHFLHPDSHFL